MKLSRTLGATSPVFDDPNLVSSAGLVPVLGLAQSAGPHRLADRHLTVPTDKGANPGLKVASLVAGMVVGADSIDDMALLRHHPAATAARPRTTVEHPDSEVRQIIALRLRRGVSVP